MPLSLVDFWKRLIQSGLADSSVPRQWAADYAKEHGSKPPTDAVQLAKWLIDRGELLPFQASCLLNRSTAGADPASGKSPERFPVLRIAPLTQSAETPPVPFSKWTPVIHDSYPDEPGIVLQIVPSRLTPEDGDSIRAITGLRGPGIPETELMALVGAPLGDRPTTIPLDTSLDAVALFANLRTGQTLSEQMRLAGSSSGASWTAPEIAPLIESLAATFSAFSSQGTGAFAYPPMPSPDRIWIDETPGRHPMLWIDPADYLSADVFDSQNTIATNESRFLYAAPETLSADSANGGGAVGASSLECQCVYALGCLAYRLRFGRHAFAAAKDEQIRSRQLRFEPPELSEAVAKGAAGDPLLRVLGYALAKDPAARFPTLDAFTTALKAAVPVAKKKAASVATSKPPAKSSDPASSSNVVASVGSSAPKAKSSQPTPPAVTVPDQPAEAKRSAESKRSTKSERPAAVEREPVTDVQRKSGSKPKSEQQPATTVKAKPDADAKPAVDAKHAVEPKSVRKDEPTASPSAVVSEDPTSESKEPASAATQSETSQSVGTQHSPGLSGASGLQGSSGVPSSTGMPAQSVSEPISEASADSRGGVNETIPVQAAVVQAAVASTQSSDSVMLADQPKQASMRRRSGRRRTAWFVLGSLWIPIFLLIIALALQDPNAPQPVAKRVRPRIPAVIPSVTGTRPASNPATNRPVPSRRPAESSEADTIELVSDPAMLWAPPSAIAADGKTVPDSSVPSTMLLPPGPAAILTFDLAHLNSTGLRDVFDPELAPVVERLQKRIAMPLDDIRMIAMAWFPGRGGVPEVALAVHMKAPRPLDELTEAWGVSMAQLPGGIKLYAGDDPGSDAFYPHYAVSANSNGAVSDASAANEGSSGTGAPNDQLVDAFAVGSIAQITQVAEVEGAPVLLPRLLEELWVSAESTDAVTMLTQPNFLIADARAWVEQTAPTLLQWVQSTLVPECGGLLLRIASVPPTTDSGDAANDFAPGSRGSFVEVRLAAAPGMDPLALKTKVRSRVDNAPMQAEDFLVSREVDPSWRLLASRLPNMWAFFSEQTRSAAIKREVILNAYLPPLALPQVALGTLLAANTTTMTAIAGSPATTEKLTLAQMLDRPMSVSFGQESLQFAVDTIVNEFSADLPEGNSPPKVEIIGSDLQLMGITQNQQVRNFAKTDQPLRKVLTDLVLGANPDRTATGPNDPKQALIWVVVGEGENAEIRITTREAATKKNYELPQEFQLEG
ncbi:serine/threonine protein kinase [Rhodopirellula sp. SWK7]|uniref:serine/threonine protein kinase n=1 Tax=Rhodopirellula sp. SWK7 TaxID=595460 RepID=UPI0002BF4455|nr:serine/threonine protein kinase [Rhodopirellula sp. SWK7]EMI45486.1 serine/threonine-protein kinase [Rhodopirellula sp. SWK7]